MAELARLYSLAETQGNYERVQEGTKNQEETSKGILQWHMGQTAQEDREDWKLIKLV